MLYSFKLEKRLGGKMRMPGRLEHDALESISRATKHFQKRTGVRLVRPRCSEE